MNHEKQKPQMVTNGHESLPTEMGFSGLIGLFEQTQTAMQTQAARSVDIALVLRNWLFGWYIVEYQQNGADRAKYGKQLLKELALQLSIRGCSERNLASFRKFHLTYADILQALPAKSSEQQIQQASPVQSFLMVENGKVLQEVTGKLREWEMNHSESKESVLWNR